MNAYLEQGREYLKQGKDRVRGYVPVANKLFSGTKRFLRQQFDKNIYTKILFTNVTVFVVVMIVLTMFSSFVVRHVIYEQAQQELLRKARRVNFALMQQTDYEWNGADEALSELPHGSHGLLRYLSDTFDSRITIFDNEGNILGTSAEQDVVPGSKVDAKFLDTLSLGEPAIIENMERETGQDNFIAFVPMGNQSDPMNLGILLEARLSNLNLALNNMQWYLLLAGMVILVVILFISVYLAMSISRPISRLSATVADLSRGNFSSDYDDDSLDEIRDLAGQLNKMSVRLQNAQAASAKMEEDRTKLFAEISHELRTPLTAVQGFVEAIRDGMVPDEAVLKRYLETICDQTVHITRLVDDMLSLSRLESGNITVEKLPLDLTALAQGVVTSMEGMAGGNNTTLQFVTKTGNCFVLGDVDRMEQIIRNLLKNAIKATKDGTIKVGVDEQQKQVILTIADNGIGIPPDELPHIWDRFYRTKNHRDRYMQENGSGLGLVIVKKLVELQDGKIEVISRLGKGTTFTITFPTYTKED
ncbi:sensor histidine kinase [Dethiobacter alkaliphilus]|uniref:sensor histidine kinase n=1 Tax=Dethiobacter alkaliphilus TaxID=427926 RepID=UPI0022268267|nr:HAMP domain-containing sensor histidine kinase [Dethiobacter alkaliphilus]MCW3489716.1 HAMP domain-containing histidine kinase [Dethiobacter alkaliphilus]